MLSSGGQIGVAAKWKKVGFFQHFEDHFNNFNNFNVTEGFNETTDPGNVLFHGQADQSSAVLWLEIGENAGSGNEPPHALYVLNYDLHVIDGNVNVQLEEAGGQFLQLRTVTAGETTGLTHFTDVVQVDPVNRLILYLNPEGNQTHDFLLDDVSLHVLSYQLPVVANFEYGAERFVPTDMQLDYVNQQGWASKVLQVQTTGSGRLELLAGDGLAQLDPQDGFFQVAVDLAVTSGNLTIGYRIPGQSDVVLADIATSSGDPQQIIYSFFADAAAGDINIFFEAQDAATTFLMDDFLLTHRLFPAGAVPGDVNSDTLADATDIDLIRNAVAIGSSDLTFDVNQDGLVNEQDLSFEVEGILNSSFGDANLDSIVNQQDVDLLRSNYGSSAGWASGNFDLNNLIDAEDLARLRETQGFSGGQPAPEPGSALCLLILTACSVNARRLAQVETKFSRPPA